MRGAIATVLLLTTCILAPCAIAQPAMLEEASPAVKACIARGAPDVEKTFESLNDGTDFLVQKLCGPEIAEQSLEWARKEAEASDAAMKARCDARATSPKSAGAEDRFSSLMCDDDIRLGIDFRGGASILISGFVSAPKATALAAETLLQLRVKRVNAKK